MSVRVLNRVWEESGQQGSDLFVLVAMADISDHNGVCYPGTTFLAGRCRISPRQVTRILGNLVQSGEVEIVKRQKGGHAKVVYRILTGLPTTTREDILTSLENAQGGHLARPGVTNPDPSIIEYTSNTSSPHGRFIKLWTDSYQQHFGCQYAFQGGKDGTAVKNLLATTKLEPEQLIDIAKAAWQQGSAFYCKSAASLTGFYSKFNEIRHELKNGTSKTKESGRGHGTANQGRSGQYRDVGRVPKVQDAK